jgi:hypothetical protein
MNRYRRLMGATGRRWRAGAMAGVTAALAVTAVVIAPSASGSPTQTSAHSSSAGAFSAKEQLSRIHLVNGQDVVADRRTFSLHVSETNDLRDRQEIDVSWTGAHPTGGILPDPNANVAAEQEYPVVLMMCRGTPAQVTPDTCWTQTPWERVQYSTGSFPSYRLDRYASAADRAPEVGVPNPLPASCPTGAGAEHWVPFVAANRHVYPGALSQPNGTITCSAGIPPEQAAATASLQPGNTTYAVSNLKGVGSTKFVITTNETNASLGCSNTVACSLVVIPIMGISCDPAAQSLPPSERPPTTAIEQQSYDLCSETGAYQPGQQATQTNENEDLAVSGELWWSASNWRGRISVPLHLAPPANVCSLHSSAAPVAVYGSYLLFQATQQWAPHFCLNKKLFPLQHVQFGEPGAKNLLNVGSINAAFQGLPPPEGFSKPVVQAPTAATGFAVSFDISAASGGQVHAYHSVRLDARLLAKLLTESYPSNPTMQQEDTALQNPTTHQPNPLDIAEDPEFQALNPGLPKFTLNSEPASTLMVMSSDSDMMTALTSYINADPEARAWLNGKPDPWGMVVNPAYKGISLPVTSWPLNDTFEPPGLYTPDRNPCLEVSPSPWLPLVASPVENPAVITLDMQFDIANSQIVCANPGAINQKLVSVGREPTDRTFIFGLTTLADAQRYQLSTAALETQGGSTSGAKFTSPGGRSFVTPTDASLRAAVRLMKPDNKIGSWPLPFAKLRTEAAGKAAYPGTMLVSTDVPTTGLSKQDATDYSQFLEFVASDGQRTGFGAGELPPGYLPLTSANGAADMTAYTKAAAQDVADQNGKVPSVTDPSASQGSAGTPPGQRSPSTGHHQPGGASHGSTTSGNPQPGQTGTHTSHTSTSTTPPSSHTNHNGTVPPAKAVPLGHTVALSSTVSKVVFPAVVLLALVCGALTLALWRLDRPRVAG